MSGKRKPRARTIARNLEREQHKLLAHKSKLAELAEGGSPQRPMGVESASVIEARAASLPCIACEQPCRVVAHEALVDENRVRRVELVCPRCATRRYVYFRIVGLMLN